MNKRSYFLYFGLFEKEGNEDKTSGNMESCYSYSCHRKLDYLRFEHEAVRPISLPKTQTIHLASKPVRKTILRFVLFVLFFGSHLRAAGEAVTNAAVDHSIRQ